MVNPDANKPILIVTASDGVRLVTWLKSPWVIPGARVLWWQHEKGWQFGPAHAFNSDLPIAGEAEMVGQTKLKRQRK